MTRTIHTPHAGLVSFVDDDMADRVVPAHSEASKDGAPMILRSISGSICTQRGWPAPAPSRLRRRMRTSRNRPFEHARNPAHEMAGHRGGRGPTARGMCIVPAGPAELNVPCRPPGPQVTPLGGGSPARTDTSDECP
jgi:hypothetical protein